jgi:hypothetical protein
MKYIITYQRIAVRIVGAISFGALFAFRDTVTNIWVRALVAGFAFVVLGIAFRKSKA